MLPKEFLSAALAAGMAVAPLQNCLGKSDTLVFRYVTQVQCAEGLTPLDLSKFTFDNDVSYLSATEQEAYRKCQTEFFNSLKHLPYKKQRELKEIYKWVPDSIKIIASRDYQDRKGYIQQRKEITSHISSQLWVKRKQIPKSIKEWDITRTCSEMLVYRYPLDTLDFKKQSLEDIVKKCGFGNLAGMIDYCNNPQNIGKCYNESVDKSTYNKTMEEVDVTRRFADKYPDRDWVLFLSYARNQIHIPWRFDLKKIDTSNLTPVEYKKMERLLKCLPPGPSAIRTIGGYRNRMAAMKKTPGVLESPEYIQKYAQDKKGIRLSAKEAQEAYQLGLELIKYTKPLRLIKRDDNADLDEVTKTYGFHYLATFFYYREIKMGKDPKIQFHHAKQGKLADIFVEDAKGFYPLGMAINPEATKKLYQDMENDLGLIIQQQENSPSVTARMKDDYQPVRDQGPGQQSESSEQKAQKNSTH